MLEVLPICRQKGRCTDKNIGEAARTVMHTNTVALHCFHHYHYHNHHLHYLALTLIISGFYVNPKDFGRLFISHNWDGPQLWKVHVIVEGDLPN